MDNSNTTASINTSSSSSAQDPTNSTPAIFKAGDAVLCPSVGADSYQLFIDDEHSLLSFIAGVNKYHTLSDGKQHPNDKSPSIFHDTPANRQIITALYHNPSITQSSQRKVIDTTTADDKEVVILSASNLSNLAFDLEHAAETLDDIGTTLALIYYENVSTTVGQSLARLAHSSAGTWTEILDERLSLINETLATTRYSKGGAQ